MKCITGILFFTSTFFVVNVAAQVENIFRRPEMSIDVRVKNLNEQLILEDKAGQMMNAIPAIPRLGIPAFDKWNEASQGLARSVSATVFPQAIASATFSDVLDYSIPQNQMEYMRRLRGKHDRPIVTVVIGGCLPHERFPKLGAADWLTASIAVRYTVDSPV